MKGIFTSLLQTYFVALCRNPLSCSAVYSQTHCDYTREILSLFAFEAGYLYGKYKLVYSGPRLMHLSADVKRFGLLDTFSAFPFLGRLKKMFHTPHFPLQQIIPKIERTELKSWGKRIQGLKQQNNFHMKRHNDGPGFNLMGFCRQYFLDWTLEIYLK